MFVSQVSQIDKIPVQAPGMKGIVKQMLLGPQQGWQGWVMRLFTVQPEGHTSYHAHDWPHINYVISGQGTLSLDGREYSLQEESIAYVPEGRQHQFINTGPEDLRFLCIVPQQGDK